jgi:outer membrane protein OmpA-like peptidoglycan-associated protein
MCKNKKEIRGVVLVGLLLVASWALMGYWEKQYYQGDVKGEDLSYVPRYPGSVRVDYKFEEYAAFDMPTRCATCPYTANKSVEGKHYFIQYEVHGSMSQLQVLRNYENAFKAKGWTIQASANPQNLDQPVTAEKKDKGMDTWVTVLTQKINDDAEGRGVILYDINVIEIGEMEQVLEIDESGMKKALDTTGKVVLHGINFDTGKATVKDDSYPLLDEVGKLLNDDKNLKLSIEGHTDNVGDKASNQKLSEARAAAVKDYLVKNAKVDAVRLTTKGFGDTKPIADNSTNEGKAQNRRVELVKVKYFCKPAFKMASGGTVSLWQVPPRPELANCPLICKNLSSRTWRECEF